MHNTLHLVEPEEETEEVPPYKYHPSHDYLYMILLHHRREDEKMIDAARRILETMALDLFTSYRDICNFLKYNSVESTPVHRMRVKWGVPPTGKGGNQ